MNFVAAKLLSIWWSSPGTTVAPWFSEEWWESVLEMWRELKLPEGEMMQDLSLAVKKEGKGQIEQEFERLFVGPASVPCPPYEAVWQPERPKHEQGMATGEVTLSVHSLYADSGLCMKQDCREFPDHIAIEFEALADVMASENGHATVQVLITDHLGKWIPGFCIEVIKQSNLDFYRILASLTMKMTNFWSSELMN